MLIVDDHPVVREGLRARLSNAPDFEVAGEAATGREALSIAERTGPDLALLDLTLPDLSGAELCTALHARFPEMPIVVLSAYSDVDLVRAALEAGAASYLLKDSGPGELLDALRRAVSGEAVIDPRAAAALVQSLRAPEERPVLTERELTVLRLAAQGLSNSEIGRRLYLSRHTVKEHMSAIMRKLEVTSRVAAALEGARRGLLEDETETPG